MISRRIYGTLYGNCIGDAIGLLSEFMTKDEAKQVYFVDWNKSTHNRIRLSNTSLKDFWNLDKHHAFSPIYFVISTMENSMI